MFKRKKQNDAAPEAVTYQPPVSSGGYVSSEMPTFHGRQRKVVVYTSDASGKIIKTFKRK
ncbi:MAG: hypothetical protein M3066_16855 [Actinomycetota bacterium]|nr:hypothetical protein [Actinomycetota bacterium]